jgi:hypothetical protein
LAGQQAIDDQQPVGVLAIVDHRHHWVRCSEPCRLAGKAEKEDTGARQPSPDAKPKVP